MKGEIFAPQRGCKYRGGTVQISQFYVQKQVKFSRVFAHVLARPLAITRKIVGRNGGVSEGTKREQLRTKKGND